MFTSNRNRTWIKAAIVVGLSATLGSGLGLAAARKARGPMPRIIEHPVNTIDVEAASPAPGLLTYRARAKYMHPFRDSAIWWCVDVRRQGPDGALTVVWSREFRGPAETVAVKRLVTVHPELPARPLDVALPPGRYSVLVGIKDDTPSVDGDGVIVGADNLGTANSVWVDVR